MMHYFPSLQQESLEVIEPEMEPNIKIQDPPPQTRDTHVVGPNRVRNPPFWMKDYVA